MRGSDPSVADPPHDPATLRRFPRRSLPRASPFVRAGRAGVEPWWFSSGGQGRFDLASPNGTCYLAADDLAALIEVLGPKMAGGVVAAESLDARRLRSLRLPKPAIAADATSRRALAFGVTPELGTIVPYDLPQRWAAVLHAAGFGGIRWWPRHDPARSGAAFALFGRSGERTSWPKGRERAIDAELRDRLSSECGIRVARRPRADRLSFAPDPAPGPPRRATRGRRRGPTRPA